MKKFLIITVLLITPILAQCDWNDDGLINVIDVVAMVDCILFDCWDGTQCDWIEDGMINIIDIVAVIDCILTDCWIEDIYGCTDPEAINYDVGANIDDGSCEYVQDLFELILIPEGEFTSGLGDTLIYLDYDYEIMKYEVTNTEYMQYLENALTDSIIWIEGDEVKGNYIGDEYYLEGVYTYYYLGEPENGYNYGKIDYDNDTFTISPGYEDHPVIDVTYFGALGMADYYSLILPTRREWEKAARGNTGWDLPWGNDDLDGSRINYWYSGDPWDNGTTPKGFFNGQNYEGFQTIDSPSPYGLYDVVGNVWEWTRDRISTGSYDVIIKGGGLTDSNSNLNTWESYYRSPDFHYYHTGFRLARDFGNIFGCTDPEALNFNPDANVGDNSCEYEEGACVDIDGNIYETVIIGNQTWMTENLKVTHYRNGDEIPTGYSNSEWVNLSSGAYSVYDEDPLNAEVYGNLYNWYSIEDERGICPENWHIPSDQEWTEMVDFLGGNSIAGGKLKESGAVHWNPPNTGATNESGFTALPGGYRHYSSGNYSEWGYSGFFWSSTAYGTNFAWRNVLVHNSMIVYRGDDNKPYGQSVRCVKDAN